MFLVSFRDGTGWHKIEDLRGRTYGRWLVESYDSVDKHGKVYWTCVCSCSNHTRREVRASHLRNGGSLSCGCLRVETARKTIFHARKYNWKIRKQ